MKKKFSKGKWLISSSCSDSIRIATENYDVVADVYDGWNSVDKQIDMDVCVANAKLIAEAPELLEALTNILKIVEDSEGVVGYHLNGDTAKWDEFDEITNAIKTIKKATE